MFAHSQSRAVQVSWLAMLLFVEGCSESNQDQSRQMPKRVSLKELEEATLADPFVLYCGADPECHHFKACDGSEFLLARTEWNLLPVMPYDAGNALFLSIIGGKIKMADASAVRDWQKRFPALSKPSASPKWRLPVMRYDRSAQPSLLILTSDGDWEDLERLDAVLNDWLVQDCPAGGKGAAGRAAPRLWFDRENSSGDLKTILVRTENFEAGWCESLAERLGTEFPFLWHLDVGYDPLQ